MIIDANLAIKENLQNIFLIEFDLNNSNKDNTQANNKQFMKLLKEINNNCIDREIFFVLNGTMHGVQMFSSELKFSVEQRKFIKSIQYKLDQYKKDLIQQKQQHPNSPENLKIKNTFFAKILSNTNIGFEFSKPHFNMRNPEKFQTNFNSIVNSKINIHKIFLEVSIPKVFLCNANNTDLTRLKSVGEENQNQIKDIKLDKFNDISNDKTASSFASNNNINNNNNTNNTINTNNTNNNVYNSPVFSTLENNNNNFSKSTLRNKELKIPLLNSDFCSIKDNNLYKSPHLSSVYPRFNQQETNLLTPDYNYLNGNYPLVFGRSIGFSINNNNISCGLNNSTFSSSLHFSPSFRNNNNNFLPVSPGGRSYIGQSNQMMFNGFINQIHQNFQIQPFELDQNGSMLSRGYSQNSIFSESYNNKSSNSVLNSSRSYYNPSILGNNNNNFNNLTNLSVCSFGRASYVDEYKRNNFFSGRNMSFNLNINHSCMSPRNVSPRNVSNLSFKNLNTSEDKKFFNGIPTIMKKIMDWEKTKEEDEDIKCVYKNEELIGNNNLKNDFISNYNLNIELLKKEEEKKNIINSIEEVNRDCKEGVCNFLLFLKKVTPVVNIKYLENFRDLTLDNYFNAFQKISLLGLKMNYIDLNKSVCNISYSLTLSSMEIVITNKDFIFKILDYLILIKKCSLQIKGLVEENYINQKEQKTNIVNKNNNYFEFFPCEKINCLKIILKNLNKLTIEYIENKPPHLRKNFYGQIKDILKNLQINELAINNISSKSYFSILYSPINSRNNNCVQSSFITYYQFKNNKEINNGKYVEIPVIGVLPTKFVPTFFLEKISNEHNNISYDKVIINSSIKNVMNLILNNTNRNSIDVEYYLKNHQVTI